MLAVEEGETADQQLFQAVLAGVVTEATLLEERKTQLREQQILAAVAEVQILLVQRVPQAALELS